MCVYLFEFVYFHLHTGVHAYVCVAFRNSCVLYLLKYFQGHVPLLVNC